MKKEPVVGPSEVKIKNESKSVKPTIPLKPSTSYKSTGGVKKAALSAGTKALLKKIGVDPKFIDDDDDESDDGKDGGYSPKKKRQRQTESDEKVVGRLGKIHQDQNQIGQ